MVGAEHAHERALKKTSCTKEKTGRDQNEEQAKKSGASAGKFGESNMR